MVRFALAIIIAGLIAGPAYARPAACNFLQGAVVIADDGTYLGTLSDEYDAKSIFNKYGTYGSPYSAKSVWNEYGQYGSEYSNKSATNQYTTTPPALVIKGKVVGYLTKNKYKGGAIDPVVLGVACFGYEPE